MMTSFHSPLRPGDFLNSAYLGGGAEVFGLQDSDSGEPLRRFPNSSQLPVVSPDRNQHSDINGT